MVTFQFMSEVPESALQSKGKGKNMGKVKAIWEYEQELNQHQFDTNLTLICPQIVDNSKKGVGRTTIKDGGGK